VALDYKLVLDRATKTLPGVTVAILDGDRDLRVRASPGTVVVVHGDLGEPMLRIGPAGVWVNRASVTAQANRLTRAGAGWHELSSGSEYVWHEHRLAPPPYGPARGPVARFTIPVTVDGKRAAISGTFVRYAHPVLWPWLVLAAALVALVAAAVRARLPVTTAFGVVAAIAALAAIVAFATADAPNGRISWFPLAAGFVLAGVLLAALVRAHGPRRSAIAGLLGGAAAAVSLGSLGVFRHGVVISSLPATASRALVEIAFVCGAAAAVTSLRRENLR